MLFRSNDQQKPFGKEWLYCFYWSFPYFLVGGVAAGLVSALSRSSGWFSGLLVLPLMYLCHLWYQIHVQNAIQEQATEPEPEANSVLAETL